MNKLAEIKFSEAILMLIFTVKRMINSALNQVQVTDKWI